MSRKEQLTKPWRPLLLILYKLLHPKDKHHTPCVGVAHVLFVPNVTKALSLPPISIKEPIPTNEPYRVC